MIFSSRSRYGLRFLLDLALHGGQGAAISLRDVARRQGISEKYLWQVVAPLRAAGFIRAERGARGGFTPAKRVEDLTLEDVVLVLEGKPKPERSGRAAAHGGSVAEVADEAWIELEQAIGKAMRSIRLGELAERCRTREGDRIFDYVI